LVSVGAGHFSTVFSLKKKKKKQKKKYITDGRREVGA